jgi:hypothetical protein
LASLREKNFNGKILKIPITNPKLISMPKFPIQNFMFCLIAFEIWNFSNLVIELNFEIWSLEIGL